MKTLSSLITVAALIAAFLVMPMYRASAAPRLLNGYCIPRANEINEAHYNDVDGTTMIDTAGAHELLSISGFQAWIGYPEAFLYPGSELFLAVELSRQGYNAGTIEFYQPPYAPDVVLVMAYLTTVPYAAPDGSHWGKHPVCSYIAPRAVIDDWFARYG